MGFLEHILTLIREIPLKLMDEVYLYSLLFGVKIIFLEDVAFEPVGNMSNSNSIYLISLLPETIPAKSKLIVSPVE